MPENKTLVITCPFCLCKIEPGQAIVTCPGCGNPQHTDCHQKLGGCAVEGCPLMVEVKKAVAPPSYLGATEKTCPVCAETIPVDSLQCPLCKSAFKESRPLSREDLLPKPDDPVLVGIRRSAKWLLFFSLIGVTSPFALLFGGIWYRQNARDVARAGPTTRTMVLFSLLICVLYLVLLSAGALLFSLKGGSS